MCGKVRIWLVILLIGSVFGSAWAAEPFVYPTKGQSPEQTEKDKSECHIWAKQQTGFDPMQPPPAAAPSSSQPAPKGGTVKGAARGALVGVTVGAITGDAGKGAAIGASSGALIGGMRQRDDYRRQQENYYQQQQQIEAQQQALKNNYDRAFGTCMQARGYSVG